MILGDEAFDKEWEFIYGSPAASTICINLKVISCKKCSFDLIPHTLNIIFNGKLHLCGTVSADSIHMSCLLPMVSENLK